MRLTRVFGFFIVILHPYSSTVIHCLIVALLWPYNRVLEPIQKTVMAINLLVRKTASDRNSTLLAMSAVQTWNELYGSGVSSAFEIAKRRCKPVDHPFS